LPLRVNLCIRADVPGIASCYHVLQSSYQYCHPGSAKFILIGYLLQSTPEGLIYHGNDAQYVHQVTRDLRVFPNLGATVCVRGAAPGNWLYLCSCFYFYSPVLLLPPHIF